MENKMNDLNFNDIFSNIKIISIYYLLPINDKSFFDNKDATFSKINFLISSSISYDWKVIVSFLLKKTKKTKNYKYVKKSLIQNGSDSTR